LNDSEYEKGNKMNTINEQQRKRAIEVMNEYLSAPPGPEGKTPVELSAELDANRIKLIETELKPFLADYLAGKVALAQFKFKIDSKNKSKTNWLWGFKGIKGQMFFNMVVNKADDAEKCDHELKSALAVPANEQIASSKIKTFLSYINRLGEQWVSSGKTRHGIPKVGSIPFFLSYFWQIQAREVWPIFYTNAVQAMTDLNIWQPSGDIAEDYLKFKQVHEALIKLFSENSKRPFSLYDVEHVFWFKGGNPYDRVKAEQKTPEPSLTKPPVNLPSVVEPDCLPESYIPPIVAILPAMARHEQWLEEAAKRSGTSIARAFEKGVNAAFTILGFKTELLGQGKGRMPDGRALALDDYYAILWDSKVREDPYKLRTDDRAIREYINTQSRELKRSYRKIYYVIVSSSFSDDFDDMIASIKMETDVSEVILLEAEALVAIVEAKLRDLLELTLGLDGIQRFLTKSGSLTTAMVREYLA
jgi:hypothetical protein